MPTSQKCPFDHIAIGGVRLKVRNGLVTLRDIPGGWSGTFRWNVSDTTPERFEERIMHLLQAIPDGSAGGRSAASRETAVLSQTAGFTAPGYITPASTSPTSQRSVSQASITGSKKKLSPQSEQSEQPEQLKRAARSDSQGHCVQDVPFVTRPHLSGGAQGSADSAMSTDSSSSADRVLRKLLKRQREIAHLQQQSKDRTLTDEEQVKVSDLAQVELQIRLLTVQTPQNNTTTTREPSSGSTRSAALTMPAAARVASELTASLADLGALVPPLTRAGTRHMAIESDGHSCGDWAHYFRCRVLEYVALCNDEESLIGLGSRTFTEFLRGNCINLRSVRGVAAKEAERSNSNFITQRRDALRTLLRAAALRGVLPWGTTRFADFNADKVGTKATEFIDLDEDLLGDSEFNPIISS